MALPAFFAEQEERLKFIQKYIHKQGYKTFYERGFTSPEREERRLNALSAMFQEFIRNSLAEIALLRLCVDPFPLLVRDDSVMYRIHHQPMTFPFGDDLVVDILGQDKVDAYRSTAFYKSHLEYFADNEEMSAAAYDLINHNFYDRRSQAEIEKQLHVLSARDVAAVRIFNDSSKISRTSHNSLV